MVHHAKAWSCNGAAKVLFCVAHLKDAMHHLGPVVKASDDIAKQQVLGNDILSQHVLGQLSLAILPHCAEALCCLQQLQQQQHGDMTFTLIYQVANVAKKHPPHVNEHLSEPSMCIDIGMSQPAVHAEDLQSCKAGWMNLCVVIQVLNKLNCTLLAIRDQESKKPSELACHCLQLQVIINIAC